MANGQMEEGYLEEWNNTDDMSADETIFTPTFITIQSGWYSFIFTLGVIGNLYIIVAVLARTTRSSTTNLFIVNLAISDLLILLIYLPQTYILDYFSWPFGKIGCRLSIPLNEVFFAVSILTLTVITLERHRAIVQPFKKTLGKKGAKAIIVGLWVVSYLTVGFPLSLIMEMKQYGDDNKCEMRWPSPLHRQLHTIFIASLAVVVPLFIIALGYARMILAMKKQSERIRRRTSTTNSIGRSSSFARDMYILEKNRKLIKMLIVLVVVFWICMLPLVVVALVLEFLSIDFTRPGAIRLVEGLYTFSISLFFSNSAFNPVAIYIMCSEMRKCSYSIHYSIKNCLC